MIACMGGWCAKREKCPHHTVANSWAPSERLCMPGADGQRLIDVSMSRAVVVDVFEGREIERRVAPARVLPEAA